MAGPVRFDKSAVTRFGEIALLAGQLQLDIGLLFKEIEWALGEERINRVTPPKEQFRTWARQRDGLMQFWTHAQMALGAPLEHDDVHDLWECIDLTLEKNVRRAFTFQDYLLIAVRSQHKCESCGRSPPEVVLEIDHVLPVSKGGSNSYMNLRFLCLQHNRSRGNRFRWADLWRR
jgi:5-methylcytosine-specific restriction endonuclease McrA